MEPNVETGYFTFLMNIDVRNFFIYLQLSHVIHYNVQQQQKDNNTNQITEMYSLITADTTVHIAYSKTCIPHRQIAVQ